MNNVSTFLWFEAHAHDAAKLYAEIVPDTKIIETSPLGTTFAIREQRYVAFNGGPHFALSPAVSIFVSVTGQAQVDALWDKFIGSGGTESRCGWLVDKYGLSWQIAPTELMAGLADPDPAAAKRVHAAMMKMVKIDVAAIEAARRG